MPTLFICGESDAFVSPKMAKAWESVAKANSRVRIVHVSGAGHLPWMDEPDRIVLEVERFLGAEVPVQEDGT